ncbi:MAG: tyrosine-protein phosphatase [Solobacterium sp.]|nr:tyrosine-protein phosphatase [Solobacterium sp.]
MSISLSGLLKTVCLIALAFTVCGCRNESSSMDLKNCPIEHEREFGGIYIKITIADFLDLGYHFGDCVRLEFSNGYVIEELPFYSGYYVPEKEELLVGYPGYPYIKAAINNGDDLWLTAGLKESDTVSITLVDAGRYGAIQEARDMQSDDIRENYESDEIFANFRPIRGGSLKENLIYRASSPVDDTYNRASYADRLSEKNGIRLIVNLSDSEETLADRMDSVSPSEYLQNLYDQKLILLPGINTQYGSTELKTRLASVLLEMCSHEGPYLIHCALGKDRTGFVCALLEMLAGASYQEILDDYMLTYHNFYHVTSDGTPAKYQTVVSETFIPLIHYIVDADVDLTSADLVPYAEAYLRAGGLSDAQVQFIKNTITK